MSRSHLASLAEKQIDAGCRERGVALLEFALVFPIVFLLFAATFESGRGLAARNQGELFAQEAATAVFHECKDKDLSDGNVYTTAEAERCVRQELASLHGSFVKSYPRSVVVATIYAQSPAGVVRFAGPQKSCLVSPLDFPDFQCKDFASRFTVERAQAELQTLTGLTGWVVVVETYLKTSGTVERILSPLGLENVTYYSVTVL